MFRLLRISCITATIAVLAVAMWFRGWDLGRVPGINGDEAWYGVQAERIADGRCFSWRTPTGNAINPFFMAPQVVLHVFVAPSFALLRLPALASGLAALLVNYVLCRRAFGARMACLTTLAHAVLPINIAYSRFAWDASQTLPFTLPVVYAAVLANQEPLRRWRWTAVGALCLAAAMIVHPTNVFVSPFFAVMIVAAWRDRLLTAWQHAATRRIGGVLALLAIGIVLSSLLPRISANVGRLDAWSTFAQRFGDLFTGVTVYEYISGASITPTGGVGMQPTTIILLWLSIVVVGTVGFALWRAIRRGNSMIDAWLVAAWFASVMSFFAIAGPGAIAPHFERYAICLVAPTVLVLARGFLWWMQPTTKFSGVTAPLLLAAAVGMLAIFKSRYFDEFNERGGRSHLTFRTAAAEPKQKAMDLIARHRDPNLPLLIQTSEWWLYWPLQYLAHASKDVTVELRRADDPRPLDEQDFIDVECWIVEFAEQDAGRRVEQAATRGSPPFMERQRFWIPDAGGRNLLVLVRLPHRARTP
jgi:hypothetical protein